MCLRCGERMQRCWHCLEVLDWLCIRHRLDLCLSSSGVSRQAQKVLSIPLNKIPRQKKSYSLAALQQLRKKLAYIRKGRFVIQKCFIVGLKYYHRILQWNSVCCLPKHIHRGSGNVSLVLAWSNEWNILMATKHKSFFPYASSPMRRG